MREMNDSGVEWIGKIPLIWKTQRLKTILKERVEKNNPIQTSDILSLTIAQGVVPVSEKLGGGNKPKSDVTAYKLAHINDIVLNSMNIIVGSVGLSKYFGCVSPVYYVLYPANNIYFINYYSYVFQSSQFQKSLRGFGNGILIKESDNGNLNTIRMKISMTSLNNIQLPIPPITTQHRIADYLDNKCAKIDAIIEHEQDVIEKLKEYKLAVIHETVSNSKWHKIKLKYNIKSIEQGWSPSAADKLDEENGWYVLSLSAVKKGNYDTSARKPIDSSANIPHHLELKRGDFLMTRSNTRELVGDVCIVDCNESHTIFSDLIYRITFNEKLTPQFALYLLQSHNVREQIQGAAKGSSGSMPKISHKIIKDINIPLVPIDKQGDIVQHLDSKCKKIDNSIKQKQSVIDKLTEYKKSLIYEAVTGKMEV